MKLTSVELNAVGSSDIVELSFRDPSRANPYNVKSIEGLEADEIVPKFYGAGSSAKYYSLGLTDRQIVVRMELNPDFHGNQSYSDLRDAIYRMIAASRTGKIQIKFKDQVTVVAAVTGFVSKIEAPKFEKIQELLVTVVCDDTWLRDPALTGINTTGMSTTGAVIVDSKSTAPHGFYFDMNILSSFPSATFYDPDRPNDWSFTISPVGGFINGDILHFSSDFNNKFVYLTRGGVKLYLADAIDLASVWPIMFPGTNKLAVTPSSGLHWAGISYYATYWGV